MNLVLVGYRGSGKSTVGAVLARRLGWPFVDLDELIVKQAGRSIAEIFSEEGESGFRLREREACGSVLSLKCQVIALGGGAVTDPETRLLAKRLGKVIWLRAPAAVLWARISQDAKSRGARPDLTPVGGLAEVEAVLKHREPLYRSIARHSVDTFPGTPEEVADAIELWYQANDAARAQ